MEIKCSSRKESPAEAAVKMNVQQSLGHFNQFCDWRGVKSSDCNLVFLPWNLCYQNWKAGCFV